MQFSEVMAYLTPWEREAVTRLIEAGALQATPTTERKGDPFIRMALDLKRNGIDLLA